ncbi:MAG: RNA-binding cell elongation regulator Jag/EloR [Pseudomonadota bacterium]
MSDTQEFSGKDVNIAIKNACSALNISREELDYKVISEGTSGIFGIVGRKDAKIKVKIPASHTDKIDDHDMEGIQSIVDEAFGQDTRREKSKPRPKDKAKVKPVQKKAEEVEVEAAEEEDYDQEEVYEEDNEEETYNNPDAVDVTQESIDLGIAALQKMANLITEDATVTALAEKDHLTLTIEGGNSGILIGRKGQTLDAMQFLTDKIINRKSEARVRVRVDIEGYMETRKANLKQLAFKMADKAKKTGRPATINQMSAQDRRIVHLALKDDTKVRTQSMGDGYYRRLVIFPKKKTAFRGKRRVKS